MPKLYRVVGRELQPVARKRLASEDQLQQWIAANPRLIGLDVVVLGREVTTESGGRIDIVGLDRTGSWLSSSARATEHRGMLLRKYWTMQAGLKVFQRDKCTKLLY
jgi:hypothetical protein